MAGINLTAGCVVLRRADISAGDVRKFKCAHTRLGGGCHVILLVLRSSIPARKPLTFAERTDTKKAKSTREKCKRSRDPAEDHGNRVGLLAQPVMSVRRPGEEKAG